MNEVIYLILIAVLIYFYLEITNELRAKYYDFDAKLIGQAVSVWFFIALFNPKPYFKKENFWEGYILYVFKLIIIVCLAFLIFKLGGIF